MSSSKDKPMARARSAQRSPSLGRGLSALFDSESVAPAPAEDLEQATAVVMVDLDDLVPNAEQPRKDFNDDKLEELTRSIRDQGIVQPLIVATDDKEPPYVIVAGERRWRAARRAGLREVPCIVRTLSTAERQKQALIENVVREDLNAMEEAEAYDDLIQAYGMTQEHLAKALGKSRPAVANTLRLLGLPDEVKRHVREGRLSAGHARALLSCPDATSARTMAEKAIANKWSVRETERRVKGLLKPAPSPEDETRRDPVALHLHALETRLTREIGTKVRIKGGKTRGRIEVSYYSSDELERLLERFLSQEMR